MNDKSRIARVIKRPSLALVPIWRSLSKFIKSDRLFLKVLFRLRTGDKMNFQCPKTYNQKIQWLKLNNVEERYSKMVDKYAVREIIAREFGDEYLIPLLGIWDNFDDIQFDTLPNQFVLKPTHDSGSVLICKNKLYFNVRKARKIINKALKRNYFYLGRETPYKTVKPRIIAEQYIVDESGTQLKDYKLFCFNGRVLFLQVDFDRFINHKRNIYDRNWNLLDLQVMYSNAPERIIERPICLDRMIGIAEQLSKSIPHLRVDFYVINDKIYFGEVTFYHEGGLADFIPPEWNQKWGDLIVLQTDKS